MSLSPDSLPNCSCFDIFVRDPKNCKHEIVIGAHKFLSEVIAGKEKSPVNSVFIGLFGKFTKTEVKNYVHRHMTKKILLELALCVIQEIILGGAARARTLQLVVEETRTGGKTVVIEKPAEEFPVDEEFVRDIDEAFFCIHDLEGKSPDIRLSSGQGRSPSYSPLEEDGSFTPKKGKPKSLSRDLEVHKAMILIKSSRTHAAAK